MEFKIIRSTRLVNDKGSDMGPISSSSDPFTADKWEKQFDGITYQRYAPARWIPVSDIQPVTIEPPPVDPPPVDPPPPSVYPNSYQIRYPSQNGVFDGQPWQEYKKNV